VTERTSEKPAIRRGPLGVAATAILLFVLGVFLFTRCGDIDPPAPVDGLSKSMRGGGEHTVSGPTTGNDISTTVERSPIVASSGSSVTTAAKRVLRITLQVDGHWNHTSVTYPVEVDFVGDSGAIVRRRSFVKDVMELEVPTTARRAYLWSVAQARSHVVLEAEGVTAATLQLKGMVHCRGALVSEVGRQPIKDGCLVVTNTPGAPIAELKGVVKSGKFEILLPAGTMLAASASGHCVSKGIVVAARHAGESLVFVCPTEKSWLHVRVVDDTGAPVAGAKLIVGRRFSTPSFDHKMQELSWRSQHTRGVTGADGKCRIGGDWTSLGHLNLTCLAEGYAPRALDIKEWLGEPVSLQVARGAVDPAKPIQVHLVRGKNLQLTVRSQDGPAERVRVWLDYGTFRERYVYSSERGVVLFDGVDLRNNTRILVLSKKWRRVEVVASPDVLSGDFVLDLVAR
jgi:hypothetical protein